MKQKLLVIGSSLLIITLVIIGMLSGSDKSDIKQKFKKNQAVQSAEQKRVWKRKRLDPLQLNHDIIDSLYRPEILASVITT